MRTLIPILITLPLAACGNVRTASDYGTPSPVSVKNPDYDLYMPYGSANATWRPPVYNRQGTIVGPEEPATQSSRADYEHAPWAYEASGGSQFAPPGTF